MYIWESLLGLQLVYFHFSDKCLDWHHNIQPYSNQQQKLLPERISSCTSASSSNHHRNVLLTHFNLQLLTSFNLQHVWKQMLRTEFSLILQYLVHYDLIKSLLIWTISYYNICETYFYSWLLMYIWESLLGLQLVYFHFSDKCLDWHHNIQPYSNQQQKLLPERISSCTSASSSNHHRNVLLTCFNLQLLTRFNLQHVWKQILRTEFSHFLQYHVHYDLIKSLLIWTISYYNICETYFYSWWLMYIWESLC